MSPLDKLVVGHLNASDEQQQKLDYIVEKTGVGAINSILPGDPNWGEQPPAEELVRFYSLIDVLYVLVQFMDGQGGP